MKKNVFFALMGAVALTGTMALTGCASTDEDDAPVNPTYNPETNTLNANFVFNVAGGATQRTRMTAENTQATTSVTFRGMEDVKLLAFKLPDDGKLVTTAQAADRLFDLGQIVAKGQISEANSHRIIELPLPVNTNTMMFYGRAFKDGNALHQGVINGTEGVPESGDYDQYISTNLSGIKFSLTKRLKDADRKKMENIEKVIAGICTRIVQNGLHVEGDGSGNGDTNRDLRASFWWPEYSITEENTKTTNLVKPEDEGGGLYTVEQISEKIGSVSEGGNMVFKDALGNTYTYYNNVAKDWKDYGDVYQKNHDEDDTNNENQDPLEEILGNAYDKLTTIKEGAIRAGSGAAVARTMTDVWILTKKVADATPTSYKEQLAKLVAKRIGIRFSNYFSTLPADGSSITWKDDAITNYKKYSGDGTDYSSIDADGLNNFPEDLMLPMGAAQMFVGTNSETGKVEFSYNPDKLNFHMYDAGTTTTTQTVNIDNLMYPSELMYYGNSPLRISSVAKSPADYPDGVTNWDLDTKWSSDWQKDKHVVSSTRSVAMIHDINYGNALLETKVKYSNDDLLDNRNFFFPGEDNETIQKNFQLTGVLIGGQPGSVDWQYLPKEDSNTKIVYDREIPDKTIPTTQPNYTMVFDNAYKVDGGYTDNGQLPVYVALEFKNNTGTDFWGDKNIIRKDGTFYLVGKLDPQDQTGNATKPTWPTTTDTFRSTPPYNTDGKTMKVNRVFIQDFMTKASFTIGQTSLQKAFVTVPDLRSAEISLGLSVDMKWENGMNFNVILGN